MEEASDDDPINFQGNVYGSDIDGVQVNSANIISQSETCMVLQAFNAVLC